MCLISDWLWCRILVQRMVNENTMCRRGGTLKGCSLIFPMEMGILKKHVTIVARWTILSADETVLPFLDRSKQSGNTESQKYNRLVFIDLKQLMIASRRRKCGDAQENGSFRTST